MRGWGKSASWYQLRDAIEAAQRAQEWERRHGSFEARERKITRCSSVLHGRFCINGAGEVVASVRADGSIKYGRG